MSSQLKKLIVVIITLNAILAIGCFAIIKTMANPIQKLSEDILAEKTELVALKQQKESIVSWQKVFIEHFSNYSVLTEQMFNAENVVNFVSSLEAIAEATQTSQEIAFKDAPKSKKKKQEDSNNKIYYDLTLEAGFNNLFNYLNAYENLNSFPEIVSLQINIQEERQPEIGLVLLPKLRVLLSGIVIHQ